MWEKRYKLKKLSGTPVHHNKLIGKFCEFIHAETIVEIGVQHGKTTCELVKAAEKTGGTVFGYDYFAPIGAYKGQHAGKEETVLASLRRLNPEIDFEKNYKLTRIDTHSDEFPKILKEDTKGRIDFAFIDGDHSYLGCKKDFETIYPLLSEDGMVAFHDTYSHIGLRKFVIDLYENPRINDGTFDIINLPFGNGNARFGLTLLSKRSYPHTNSGITHTIHDPEMCATDIYELENSWYDSRLERRKKSKIRMPRLFYY